jgi:hypothetical protein
VGWRRCFGTVGPTDSGHCGYGGNERCRKVNILIFLKIIDRRISENKQKLEADEPAVLSCLYMLPLSPLKLPL